MRKDFTKTLKTLDGSPFQDGGKDVLLKTVCVNALFAPDQNGGKLSGEEHIKRYALAKRLHDSSGEVDVSSEEITLLKNCMSASFITPVVGAAFEILEG